jgi:RNA polymerase sigma factor (sigma-70 family)
MTTTRPGTVLRHLRELVTAKEAAAVPDQQLLDRFARGREEAAFTALVRRHGPLVLGVCRRVLRQEQDAEDVFQATFLVLARKAAGIDRRVSLGGWLYRVAFHMALKTRKQAAARQRREARTGRHEETDPLAEVSGRELLAVFDEELQRLPECERVALVHCYLQGKTRDEAAREVGCSESTLKRRLERGKERMRQRLARRGVALSAALLAAVLAQRAKAVVPARLAASVVEAARLLATGRALAGVVSARAAALADEALRAMTAGKVKLLGALLLGVALLGVGTGLFASGPRGAAPPPADPAPAAKESPKVAPADDAKKIAVSGRVLDADGKPLGGADVAVMARPNETHRGGDLSSGGIEVLGRGKTDAEGRYRLELPRTSPQRFPAGVVVARGPGHGLGWQRLDLDADKPTADVRLTREQVIRGRFVDLQGAPAVGVTVSVTAVGKGKRGDYTAVGAPAEVKHLPFWPAAAVTDKDGRFELHGVGRGAVVRLGVRDDRFAAQGFEVATDAKGDVKEYKAPPLEPAHIIEGTVTYADTGKPAPGARLTVYAGKSEVESLFGTDAKVDGKGRFRINPTPGNFFLVSAYAPDGEPYLAVRKRLTWPKAAVKQQVDFALPRGVLVRGQVTDGGKPVAKATAQFIPRQVDNPNFRRDVLTGWENTAVSGADGRFDLCVPPGPGHLLIHAPAPDYVFTEIGERMLSQGKEGGKRYYAHAVLPLDLKPGPEAHELTAALKRSVTVKGRIVGPDGMPVAEAWMLSRLNVSPLSSQWLWSPIPVRDGRFELHGCDPEKTYPVCFLDAKNKAGATVEISGKQTGEEVTVRLAPCGQATTRLLDGDGKPMVGYPLWFELVVTPGASQYDFKKTYEKGELAADAEYVVNIDHLNYRDGPLTDKEGRITFPALIPGATYRIVEVGDRDDMVKCEFKAESGKTVKLPDVVRKKQPGAP